MTYYSHIDIKDFILIYSDDLKKFNHQLVSKHAISPAI